MLPDWTVCGFQRWGLAQSWTAYQNNVQCAVALPVAFDTDTVSTAQGCRCCRQHGCRDELNHIVLVFGHVKYNGLYSLRECIQRETCVFGMLRLHADPVT